MAEWLEQASQWHEVYCHHLEVVILNPSQAELGVRSTSIPSRTWTKQITASMLSNQCNRAANDVMALHALDAY